MRVLSFVLIAASLSSCAPATVSTTGSPTPASTAGVERMPPRQPAPVVASGNIDPRTPLSSAQREWVERTLASLTLRERAGQMVNVWVLGDYTNTSDSSFAEVLRWIQLDKVGGVTMSLGSPIEVAEKINAMQRAARVPLMVGADLEPNLGRLEGGVFTHYLMDAGGATVFPNAMAIAATGRDQDAYDVGRKHLPAARCRTQP